MELFAKFMGSLLVFVYHYPVHLRRIRYYNPETSKTLVFLTNHFALPALTICALYRCTKCRRNTCRVARTNPYCLRATGRESVPAYCRLRWRADRNRSIRLFVRSPAARFAATLPG